MTDGTASSSAAPLKSDSVDDVAVDWTVRRNDPSFGPDDERAYEAWCAADPHHGAAAAYWQVQWATLGAVSPADTLRLRSRVAIERAMVRPIPTVGVGTTATAAPSRRRRVSTAVAASAAAIVVLAAIALQIRPVGSREPTYAQRFDTARGATTQARLPDGSQIRLDSATHLEVRYDGAHRDVVLSDGQAAFQVERNPDRPFSVTAGNVKVTVLGTRFAVRHTPGVPGHGDVEVSVEHGRVRVERTLGRDSRVLTDGLAITATTDGTLSVISPLAAADFALWRAGRVRFDDTRLDAALAELARYGEPGFTVRDPAVAALRISGVFDPRDTATFAQVLPLSLPVRLRTTRGITEIVAATGR